MLAAAVAMVNRTGLTMSLEHISLEEVIRDAGVSRSAVYRRWPYKDLFFRDLLREVARAANPGATDEREAAAVIRAFARERLDWLETAEGRRRFCAELLRQGASGDVASIATSAEWRTYIALHATFLSLTDDALRDEVRAALADSEGRLTGRLAHSYEHISGLLGLRLRPELGASFELLAGIANATLRGVVITGLSTPGPLSEPVRARLGSDEPEEWSPAGLGIAALVLAFLEPDPAVTWNAARVEAVRRTISAEDWPPT